MGKTLYLEADTGISGDMTVAALLDLGASKEGLISVLESINVDGFRINISRVKKSGLDCMDFDVILDEVHENNDHNMEYLYGHLSEGADTHQEHHHEHDHDEHHHDHDEHHHDHDEHHHDHEHEHHHDHDHDKHHHDHEHSHEHHHEHRGFNDIKDIIDRSSLNDNAKAIATRIFEVIAEAEAKAHGETFENVHFHEVGAVDSIVDVLAVAYALDNLDITEVIVPYLAEGKGSVRCQHGVLPVPVPAVTNIVMASGIKLKMTNTLGELVTPTGAAIVAAVKTTDKLPDVFKIVSTGLGAGKRNYERPSILRAMLIEGQPDADESSIYRLETNIDDCSGEQLGYVMERLLNEGARDVHYIPVFMKKNRPAYELVVICDSGKMQALENIIFEETTTIGIRKNKVERTTLERSLEKIETVYGSVTVKKCVLPTGEIRCYPEFDEVKKIASSLNIPYGNVLNEINKAINN